MSGVEQFFVLHECLVGVLVVRRASPHWRRTEGRPEGPAQATACTGRLGVPDRERGRDTERERERGREGERERMREEKKQKNKKCRSLPLSMV